MEPFGLPIELLTGTAGMVGGFVARQLAESSRRNHEQKMAFISALTDAHDAAFTRTKDGGTWMRRAIYALVAFMFIMLAVAAVANIPVVVEVTRKTGWWIFSKDVTEFATIHGYFFPPEIRAALLGFIGAYLGQGIK